MTDRKLVPLRIPIPQLEEIDRRARALRLTRTEYMIRCALGEQVDPGSTDARVEELERRVGRIEESQYAQTY